MLHLIDKAKKIRLAIFDVDGVLSNGTLLYGPDGAESKSFHVHDGMGMKLLLKSGIDIAIITARQSEVVAKRMAELGITHVYQGYADKVLAYDELKKILKLTDEQIAYTGDDLADLPLLRRAGLAFTVPNAPEIMQQYVSAVTKAKGGRGAAREICDMIMQAQGTLELAIQYYLAR